MKRIIKYLRYAFKLLKLNFWTMLAFELFYKLAVMAIAKPAMHGVMKLAMRLQGLTYLSDETLQTFVRAPSTWVLLIVIVLIMAFLCLFDICCIIICIHASYRKQEIPLPALMRKGLRTSLRVVYQRNFVMILYLLIIIPMTHAVIISGYMTTFNVPHFIQDYIFSKVWLAVLYVGFWIFMGLWSFRWIFGLHYFCLEDCNFKQARVKSVQLMQGRRYWINMLILFGWNGLMFGAYYGVIMGGAWLVSRVNSLFAAQDFFASLTLSGISLLMEIGGALFYCFGLPLFFLCVSLLFYYYKAVRREPIARSIRDLDGALRLTKTAWAKKLFQYRRRIAALSVAVMIAINFGYAYADKKGLIHAGVGDGVEVTAHRGYSAQYPENTIFAFKGAIEIGADWIELDVQETKDGQVIVMHDSNFERTTGLNKNVWEVSWDEVKDLDAGSWFNAKYREARIPTLEEVLKVTRGRIRLNIEIKPTGHEKQLEQSVAELLEKYHMKDSCVVSSMHYSSLRKIKEVDSEIQTAYITSVSYGDFNGLDAADGYSVESTMVTKGFVNQAHSAGKRVYIWTVNSEDRLERVLKLGADNVITDDPVMARRLIYEMKHSTFWDTYVEQLLELGD